MKEPGQLSYEEAAQALDVRLPALKTLIHRLRRGHAQRLRDEVARRIGSGANFIKCMYLSGERLCRF